MACRFQKNFQSPYEFYLYTSGNGEEACHKSRFGFVKPFSDSPAIKLEGNDHEYVLYAKVPGFSKLDLDIDFDEFNKTLILSGRVKPDPEFEKVPSSRVNEKSEETDNPASNISPDESQKTTYQTLLSEFDPSPKNFKRSITFKDQIDPQGISADLDNGVLVIKLRKIPKEAKTHQISIQ